MSFHSLVHSSYQRFCAWPLQAKDNSGSQNQSELRPTVTCLNVFFFPRLTPFTHLHVTASSSDSFVKIFLLDIYSLYIYITHCISILLTVYLYLLTVYLFDHRSTAWCQRMAWTFWSARMFPSISQQALWVKTVHLLVLQSSLCSSRCSGMSLFHIYFKSVLKKRKGLQFWLGQSRTGVDCFVVCWPRSDGLKIVVQLGLTNHSKHSVFTTNQMAKAEAIVTSVALLFSRLTPVTWFPVFGTGYKFPVACSRRSDSGERREE